MRYLVVILLILSSCASVRKVDLYQTEVSLQEGINGFTSIDIFSSGDLMRFGVMQKRNVILLLFHC